MLAHKQKPTLTGTASVCEAGMGKKHKKKCGTEIVLHSHSHLGLLYDKGHISNFSISDV